MIYAERISEKGTEERGVFLSLEEFLPYRIEGWSGTPEINVSADDAIEMRSLPESVLCYFAPMLKFGKRYRDELDRRRSL